MTKAEAATQTANVLDMMTSGIVNRKSAAAAKLTPVGSEVQPTHVARMPDLPTIFMPQEAIEDAIREARKQAYLILKACDDIERGLGVEPEAVKVDPAAAQKAAEREADAAAAAREASQRIADAETVDDAVAEVADFNAAFALKQAAAKAATFAKPVDGWACPTHGGFVVKLSRKQREYRGCPSCDEFERL